MNLSRLAYLATMRHLRKVAVLGSGVMGSAIACHCANAGLQVLMLDILPPGINPSQLKDAKSRNSVAAAALANTIKQKPSPLYKQAFASRISIGNFADDMPRIKDCDWVIEVVVERLDIKQEILAQVDKYRKPGSIISTNTSGIPVNLMLTGKSKDFSQHFLGTHFFNPPRYLPLLEIIPAAATDPDVVAFVMDYGDRFLGKKPVLCKDTPAFIANRVGVYAMALIFQFTVELDLTIDEADRLTGPAIGRPASGTFRLADLVGLDVAKNVIEGLRANCPADEQVQALQMPSFFQYLLDQKWLGNKTGKGFYQKTSEKDEKGRSIILGLNLQTHAYEKPARSSLPSLALSKQIEDLPKRLRALIAAEDKGGALIRKSLSGLFAYASKRVPEISDTLYAIDDALRNGFAWDMGPFEYWDAVGLDTGIRLAENEGYTIARWVYEMQSSGVSAFYKTEHGIRYFYDTQRGMYVPVPRDPHSVRLSSYRENKPVFENNEVLLHDIGEQVLCLEFRSKMNAIGEGILRGINAAIDIAESGDWRGLVIGNEAKHFSVGANLMLIGMLAFDEQWDELEMAVRLFQETSMRCRYSAIPVVAATQGYVFGGSCEIIMHCDAVCASAESYIGLVEAGVGLLPGGAGSKEFALRASDRFFDGDVMIPTLLEAFKTIALATVSTSAHEAFDHGYLRATHDRVIINGARVLQEARQEVMRLSQNYTPPVPRQDILVLGRQGLGTLYTAANELYRGHYASEYDIHIARKMAWVLCGGDLSEPQKVTERYLLDIEREAFLSLVGEQKTQQRIQHMLEHGKPLRN